jgi:hypothetical protein
LPRSSWDPLVLALCEPSLPLWQRVGVLGPRPKNIVETLRGGPLARLGWLFADRGKVIFAKPPGELKC